jgi:dihydrofolate reductase
MRGWFADHTPLVLTRRPETVAPPGQPVASVAAAVSKAARSGAGELMVLGGAAVFEQAFPLADRIVLSHVHTRTGESVKFPSFDRAEWTETSVSHHPADCENPHAFTVTVLERTQTAGALQRGAVNTH